MYLCILTQATIKCAFLRDKKSDIIIINIIRQPKPVSWFETISLISRVGYRLNFIDSDSDSAYRFRFFLIPSFDSNVIK